MSLNEEQPSSEPKVVEQQELCLDVDREILAQLVALLPPHMVNVQSKGVTSPFVRSLVETMLASALAHGYCIDRTNGDALLAEWDGWLMIDTPGAKTFLQVRG